MLCFSQSFEPISARLCNISCSYVSQMSDEDFLPEPTGTPDAPAVSFWHNIMHLSVLLFWVCVCDHVIFMMMSSGSAWGLVHSYLRGKKQKTSAWVVLPDTFPFLLIIIHISFLISFLTAWKRLPMWRPSLRHQHQKQHVLNAPVKQGH